MIKSLAKCVLSTAAVAALGATLSLMLVAPAGAAVVAAYNGNKVFCGATQCGCLTTAPPFNCNWYV